MITTLDLLSGKEKRDYKKAGGIKMSNVYESIMPIKELETYSKETQKNILEKWRDVHTTKEIQKGMGISSNTYYRKLYDVGITKELPNYLKTMDKKKKSSTKKPIVTNEAKKGDIIQYFEFRKLPKKEQYYLLDNYYDRYTTASIAEQFNKTVSVLHQVRYTLKKYMTDHDLPLFDQEEKKRVWELYGTDKPQKKEKSVAITNGINNEYIQMAQDSTTFHDEDNVITSDHIRPQNEEETKEKNKNEWMDTLKETLREELMQEMKKTQQELMETVQQERAGKDAEAITPATAEKAEEKQENNMTFSYKDEKEGFLLHEDIKRFISVLMKNPDNFEVDIRIKKK